MGIDGFDWDEGNRSKRQKHGLSIEIIESVFSRRLAILPDEDYSKKERRYRGVGKTDEGRAVFIVFALRNRDNEILIRPISARYMHQRKSRPMKKKIPTFKSDRAAAAFVANADLSRYDLSGAELVRFEMKRKAKSINLRLPEELYDAVRERAQRAGLPYQRFIRLALERVLSAHK